jgi:hypothetical protein
MKGAWNERATHTEMKSVYQILFIKLGGERPCGFIKHGVIF